MVARSAPRLQTEVDSPHSGERITHAKSMRWFFGFFLVSGFCSLLYEIVWLRLSMAQFGVTTALVSIVLSVFMAGLGLGSWVSGRLLRSYEAQLRDQALRLYAAIELMIGISAILVPYELATGRSLLESTGLSSSGAYYLFCGVWMAFTLIPWCACMGATIPVAMLAIRNRIPAESGRSFSFLYVANVLGGALGTILPLLIIEGIGFRGTLKVGAVLNVMLASTAFLLATRATAVPASPTERPVTASNLRALGSGRRPLFLLFATGLTSMAIEVVWIRLYTPYLGTVVYAFAAILLFYLVATFAGSRRYRRWSRQNRSEGSLVWALLGFSVLLPAIMSDPGIHLGPFALGPHGPLGNKVVRLVIGVFPFSAILGFLTPMLVDRWSDGDPDRAGRAYAVNVVGCILGPLFSGFILLPMISERWILLLFALPWFATALSGGSSSAKESAAPRLRWEVFALLLLGFGLMLTSKGYEAQFPRHEVLRDNTATIIATGEGMSKHLLVNGMGITVLTPVTKIMAHLTLSSLDHTPQSALVICFGMGTTYRSLLSWNISTTAVELVPSVPRMFWYYHPDGPQLFQSPLSRVVIDDGRRYLERTHDNFDVINLDPPPPVQAAGSSMLYSTEFYSTARRRLRPGGILEQWVPIDPYQNDNQIIQASIAKAIAVSFPHARVFRYGNPLGLLFLASDSPIPMRSSSDLVQRMPPAAVKDLMEWGPEATPEKELGDVLASELPIADVINQAPNVPVLQDDRPVNEYYILRRIRLSGQRQRISRSMSSAAQ